MVQGWFRQCGSFKMGNLAQTNMEAKKATKTKVPMMP